MSDDERATPCWYTRGVWHDADGKPVKIVMIRKNSLIL